MAAVDVLAVQLQKQGQRGPRAGRHEPLQRHACAADGTRRRCGRSSATVAHAVPDTVRDADHVAVRVAAGSVTARERVRQGGA
jgi:hypothetical protein